MKTKEESIKEIFDRTKELMHGYVDKMTNRMETAIREGYNAGYRTAEKENQSEYQRGYQTGYNKGFEDGLDDWDAHHELIDELKEAEYNRGYADAEAHYKVGAFDGNYKVGDEVIADNGTACFVITSTDGADIGGIDSKGETYAYLPHEICYKTGRHFDVESFLKQFAEDVNG